MPTIQQRITPFLWFDHQAEEAARFYTGIFPNSTILTVNRYGKSGARVSGRPEGSVMTVAFQLDGQELVALNGGPHFHFSEAVSFAVNCADQRELDHYWDRLSEGGDPKAQQCGWLKDKFGLSWQVVPARIAELFGGADAARLERVTEAMNGMKKIDIAALRRAFEG